MADRKDERRTNVIVGAFVVIVGVLMTVSLFVIATSEGLLDSRTSIQADFRTITGLSRGSPVQLAGNKVGTVSEVNFITATYPCEAATEDFGRPGDGRTDRCEQSLFCAAEGLCAEFEEYSGSPESYAPCTAEGLCGVPGEACVSPDLRRRYRRARFTGPDGVCVPYKVQHARVSVTMQVQEDKLVYIRDDSRATISSNGVLGDQLININVGQGKTMEAGGRLQSTPSLVEELFYFKDRLDSITDKVDRSLAGVAGLFDSLNNEGTKKDVQGILANANEITGQVARGEGVIGGLFNDPEMKADVSETIRSVRVAAADVQSTTSTIRRDFAPVLRNVSRAADEIADLGEGIQDPANRSVVARLIHDDEMGDKFRTTLDDISSSVNSAKGAIADVQVLVAEVNTSLARGEGTLGKLFKDPKVYDDLVKLLGNIDRNNTIKRMIRFVVEQEDASESAPPLEGLSGAGRQATSTSIEPAGNAASAPQ